jgi:DNA-binding CsgD family transcriptional regulator
MKSPDYATFLRALPALYEARTMDELPDSFLDFINRFVPSDAIGYNEVDLKKGNMIVTVNPRELISSKYVQILGNFINEHPLVEYQQRTGDTSARKISDLLSQAQYHRTSVYQEVYRHIDSEDQFAIALRMNRDAVAAISLNRSSRSFSEADRELLNLAQPHLIQAYRNAEILTRLRKPLAGVESLADALPLGLILLDRRFRILFSTERARKLLALHFHKRSSHRVLPPMLRSWLVDACKLHGHALPHTTRAFSLSGPAGDLSVRCVRKPGCEETILLLQESAKPHSAERLRPLGLTAREAEVLLWVADGKSNPEIAIILGAAPRTIQKHLENIFWKLGVQTRTGAARRALEIFNTELPEF